MIKKAFFKFEILKIKVYKYLLQVFDGIESFRYFD